MAVNYIGDEGYPIPAVAILSEDGKPLYATRSGELADARKMGDAGIYEFFAKVASNPAQ